MKGRNFSTFKFLLNSPSINTIIGKTITEMPKVLSSNIHYTMHQVDDNDSDFSFLANNTLKTIFIV